MISAEKGSSSEKFASDADEFLEGLDAPPPEPRPRDLIVVRGDLWNMHRTGSKVVVTTNIGWDPRSLRNNMGAGVALQAATQWPELPKWYGEFARSTSPHTPVVEREDLGLIFFPVKPLLDPLDPERSWDQLASLPRIEQSLKQLREPKFQGAIALGFPGAGNGGLPIHQVRPLLEKYLTDDRFTVVDRNA